MSELLSSAQVVNAFRMACERRERAPDIVHSDRGTQYASGQFVQALGEHGCAQSMSRRANCLDNAVAESFFRTLKVELVYQRKFKTRDEARLFIFDYVEVFYNRKRMHSYLKYKSPTDFENRVKTA